MGTGHEIRTERLRLRLMATAEIRALLEGHGPPGIGWAEGYPMDGTLVAAAMQAKLADAGTAVGLFGHYQVLLREPTVVIGDIGFLQPPDAHGDVSLAFGIVPAARGHGYATEALRALLGWAVGRPEIRRVHADTDLVNLASQHVLAGAGMAVVHDGPDRKLYELRDL